ncbi:fumarylacetoacetate hydrolase family protein [Aureimonas jatrophae]|uniref:2-keto-4-pentenoate hydratase/2-oxohepta-3-ene-1,7-dioic acid hydratase (Catechol pathway) n=1 Tax=Aureimonas jatrophae TaxID=1166073 RepID=A0A1H0MI58_9HYPH|nr:fumarylacetoacetate hydrolase family protein [Aureimonas jatrophae]MBB3952945.1 2-keto-4-pentenoate hydratase/2-oxohepta-3-ene-1,7-dioic acid hydratase in catechol pathway [Aureimonas jatrophae]SDO80158.1 2-keto-4-pentenoate hydratase/2-oxohepta-3-ene-1,7-dioic acid hydratase (catechol pathway) [Aureimonas jatrophae]
MKLVRHGAAGSEKPGIVDANGRVRDLSGTIRDIDGETLSPEGLDRLRAIDPATLPLVPEGVRLGVPVARVGNLVCIGLNYTDHAEETNAPIPSQPIIFNKHTGALSGPNDDVILPPGSTKLDWEVELAFVMGRTAWHVDEADALSYVAGYTILNDLSEREYQLEWEGQWSKGKSYPTFAPCGPWLVTGDELGDPQQLDLWLDLNEQREQTGTTTRMIFTCAHIVSYASRFMKLEPGDIITTGTPPGVGLGRKPPVFMKAGDTMRLGITGLGEQQQTVRPRAA